MTIGERIKSLREDAGMFQEDLGNKIGVSRQTIASWEADRTIPNIKNVVKMAHALGVDEKVITGTDMETRMQAQTEQEFMLLENFRKAGKDTQAFIMQLLTYTEKINENN